MSKQFQPGKTNRSAITQESNIGSTSSSATATHFYASSIAILNKESLSKIESNLLELSSQSSPFLQREVICRRLDDENEERKAIEQDNMYQPIRKARIQSRLRVRFENERIDLRLFSKPSGKSLDYIDIYNLICVPLECQQESKVYTDQDINGIVKEIDAGVNVWQQIIQAMGWEPIHTIIKKGLKFIILEDVNCTVQASIFQLYKVNSTSNSQSNLEKISDTHILHVSATLPFKSRNSKTPDSGSSDASRLSERAQAEIAVVQDRLKGLVKLNKDDE